MKKGEEPEEAAPEGEEVEGVEDERRDAVPVDEEGGGGGVDVEGMGVYEEEDSEAFDLGGGVEVIDGNAAPGEEEETG